MSRTSRRKLTLLAGLLAALAVGLWSARQWYISRPSYGLPYKAEFSEIGEDSWTAWGGSWEVMDGSMRNDSNDRGAKLVTGSPSWRNYVVEGDLQLLGAGSIGILGRVSEAALGENAFKGYLAGVRTADHSLFLGAYDFIYREAARVEMPEPIRPYRWYHIKLEVADCRITASAWLVGTESVQTRTVEEPDCFQSGSIGLRTNGTGGIWRNVKVSPIHSAVAVAEGGALLPEADLTAFQNAAMSRDELLPTPVQPIQSLPFLSPIGSPVAAIRGSVTLTRPTLYVQDSTGGVEVQFDGATPLKVGDEVEVTGEANLDGFSPVLRNARFRRIRQSLPEGPLDVTAHLVADGSSVGQFVQIHGLLRSIETLPGGAVAMVLEDGTQSYRAIMQAGRGPSHVRRIAVGSQLRLRGVSAVDSQFNNAADPFVILVRSAEGVDVVTGPSLWRPTTFLFLGLAALSLIFACNHLYFLVKHWRLRALADERERLAHQIHDTLAQSFAGIGFQLQAIRNTIPPNNEAMERHVDMAMAMANTSHEEARRCIASLRPDSPDQIVLLPALREYAKFLVKDDSVRIEVRGEEGPDLPPRLRDTFFRIGKEAVSNSILHAQPHMIRIALQRQSDSLNFSVEDDGVGFEPGSDSAGFGLLGMRARANDISAELTVWSKHGHGTRVTVRAKVVPRFPGRLWHELGHWKEGIWRRLTASRS